MEVPPTLPTVNDEYPSLSSAAAARDDDVTCLDDSHSTDSPGDVGSNS